MRKNSDFRRGLRLGLPIALGYLSVSFAFGIYAVASGLTPVQAVVTSLLCVTSAGQMAAVPLLLVPGAVWELVLSQLVINLRYALMSVSISQKLAPSVRLPQRLLFSFVNTDETFAVASVEHGKVDSPFLFGLILLPYVGWASGTALGAFAGSVLPAVVLAALGIALYAMFIAIVVPPARHDRPILLCVALSVVLSCLFTYVPGLNALSGGFVVIVCSVLASAFCAWRFPVAEKEADA